ncbi:uncharacterized protein LOC129583589 [Paramacrobiotus metropolitanus]|uniref:uncharacterized protein LOC129583589 n=1 Tax=Paramacrobiotus metropolitanus TaxID=2943436 RepID=UPI002445918B|nr:uncharacterized protein LOC129583589 [Paramacrobiotus metropolitanus]
MHLTIRNEKVWKKSIGVIHKMPKLAAKLKKAFLSRILLKPKIKILETDQQRINRFAQKASQTNAWINDLIANNHQRAIAIYKFVKQHDSDRHDLFAASSTPWHEQLIDAVRNVTDKRYAPPLKFRLQIIDAAQFEMMYWNMLTFPLMDEVLGRFLTETFAPSAKKSQIHKKIDIVYGPSLLPAAYKTFGAQEQEILFLENTIRKVHLLGEIRDNAVKIPSNDWKPDAFSFYQENLYKNLWVEDPLAEIDWLPKIQTRSSPSHEFGMRSAASENTGAAVVLVGQQSGANKQNQLTQNQRDNSDKIRTGKQNRKMPKPSRKEHPANGPGLLKKPVQKGSAAFNLQYNWETKCLKLTQYNLDARELFWRQLLQEWVVGYGYDTLLADLPYSTNNPQPVEVIDQIASPTGIERLRGVLSTLLPNAPSTERAKGYFLLQNKVLLQLETWNRAFEELMRVITMVASTDTFRAVRFAATIITGCRHGKFGAEIEKEMWRMFRSALFVNRWTACHLFVINEIFTTRILHEIFDLLFCYVKKTEYQNRLVQLLARFPSNYCDTIADEISGRLDSPSSGDRIRACRNIFYLSNPLEEELSARWNGVKEKVMSLARNEEHTAVRLQAVDCLQKQRWMDEFCKYFADTVKLLPEKITDKLRILDHLKAIEISVPNLEENLVQYLNDECSAVRLAALDAVNCFPKISFELIQLLLKMVQFDYCGAVRCSAFKALEVHCDDTGFRSSILDCCLRIVRCEHILALKERAFALLLTNDAERTRLSDLHGYVNGFRYFETNPLLAKTFADMSSQIEEIVPGLDSHKNTLQDRLTNDQNHLTNILCKKLEFHERAQQRYNTVTNDNIHSQAWRNIQPFSNFTGKF